jgi:membrane-anchored glycerophosphoryl diester phosphodiesterase (GDPDase)
MQVEKLYSINSEINNMLGGEMMGGDCAVWVTLLIVIIVIVGIIFYLSGIFVFTVPKIFTKSSDLKLESKSDTTKTDATKTTDSK